MKCPHCGKETENQPDTEQRPGFVEFKRMYPKREGGQRWPQARRNYDSLIKRGLNPLELNAKANQYYVYCAGKNIVGTQFVMQAATFLGSAGGWEEEWEAHNRFISARRQLQEQS